MANNFLSSFANGIRRNGNQNNGLARVARWLTDEQDTLRQQEGIRGNILNDEHYYSEKPIMGSDDPNFFFFLMALFSDKPTYNNGCEAIVKAFQNGTVNNELASLLLGAKGCLSGSEQETELLEPEPPDPWQEPEPQGQDNKQPQGSTSGFSPQSGVYCIKNRNGKVIRCVDLNGNTVPIPPSVR
jgi:hypothetical protein